MNTTSAIQAAIETDLAALKTMSEGLGAMDQSLAEALELISEMSGRLIVTGLGKSGHIGAKLAATFSSTGTPAYFLHPAEASHGDLGMVQPDDVILALSWSGETRELSDVIGYAKRHAVRLIAITGTAESALARAADVALVLPKVREACPHNLAPTTSTLLQLALGDALAIAVLQMRGFSEESFHSFHPGGSLGAALKRVDEIMIEGEDLPLVAQDTPVMAALNILSSKGQGIVGVTKDGELQGVITDGDIRRYLERNAASTMQVALHETPAMAVMTKGSVILSPEMLVGETLRILQTKRISAAFVASEGSPVGLITMLRLLNRGAA
ncbi:KpsF/GutQ family sugar-phosphate isomerase [uncultured Boseongicola sp.]|uniref:KpsF/GutQ family sugar-phosphate isomerase n=1 Tax=uncultured Boseongicola sp. TaxID=1648499 RepID=UPI00260FB581|nr:KpsF/GutQ family sugar-phosphate isomerase [uncultured Boseongicola sp.]